ncbi:MAG TPA: DUF2062 domain-containing protein [Terracidiphilus sp.]|nr:DUF2062 domain-containing protein [Terracidiphilus sp.]
MRIFPNSIKRNAAVWLQLGISPQRLALTLALGFAIGCIPVVGIPTVFCTGLALALRLNLPAIQAANYAAMPLQLILIVPFVRLGGWLFATGNPQQTLSAGALLHLSPWNFYSQVGGLAGHAMLAWLVVATPSVAIMTLMLTLMLSRIPALASAGTGD